MPLQFLIFDASDDGNDTGSWEAMASVRASQVAAVLAEVRSVLDWAEANSPGPFGPLDDGGIWEADHQLQTDGDWVTVTFTIVGPWDWGQTLLAHFASEDF